MTSSAQQLLTLGWMVITGVGVGFVFDLYRITRGLLRPRWLLTALGDFIFWLLVAGFTYGILLQVNFGEVRSFIFLGIFLGLFIYYRLFSSLVLKGALFLLGVLFRAVHWGKKILDTFLFRPVSCLFRILLAPLRWLQGKAVGLAVKGKGYAKGIGRRWGKAGRRQLRLWYRLLKYKLLFFTRKK